MSFYPIRITCLVKGRKSAHGAFKGGKASFQIQQEAVSSEEAVKLLAMAFPKEDGYRVEVASPS